jgi:hypothetical protein
MPKNNKKWSKNTHFLMILGLKMVLFEPKRVQISI